MDIHMPELTGVEATRRIRNENADVRVLVLTAYNDPAYVHALLDAGADGYILKTAELSELYNALQDVAVGRTSFNDEVMAKAADTNRRHSLFITAVQQLAYLLHSSVFRVVIAFGFVNANRTARTVDQPKHGRASRVRSRNHVKR